MRIDIELCETRSAQFLFFSGKFVCPSCRESAKEAAEKVLMKGEDGGAGMAGAKSPRAFCDAYGPAEAVPLLQSLFDEFFSKL